jgi:hypothetical protein
MSKTNLMHINSNNIEDIWSVLEDKYNFYSTSEYRATIVEEEFIAIISWQYQSSLIGLTLSPLCQDSCPKLMI